MESRAEFFYTDMAGRRILASYKKYYFRPSFDAIAFVGENAPKAIVNLILENMFLSCGIASDTHFFPQFLNHR